MLCWTPHGNEVEPRVWWFIQDMLWVKALWRSIPDFRRTRKQDFCANVNKIKLVPWQQNKIWMDTLTQQDLEVLHKTYNELLTPHLLQLPTTVVVHLDSAHLQPYAVGRVDKPRWHFFGGYPVNYPQHIQNDDTSYAWSKIDAPSCSESWKFMNPRLTLHVFPLIFLHQAGPGHVSK